MNIRNLILALILSLFQIGFSSAQNSTEIFQTKDMVFYGLDFSKARFTSGFGLTSPASMQDKYMPALNELMIMERKRYDVAKSYRKKNTEYYFYLADQHNSDFDVYESYVSDDIDPLSEEDIKDIIQYYKDDKHSGLGLLYIVDEVSHIRHLITIQIVFFDIDSSEILLRKRARGDMHGFSIRNYYAGGIRQIIKDSEKNYLSWKNALD